MEPKQHAFTNALEEAVEAIAALEQTQQVNRLNAEAYLGLALAWAGCDTATLEALLEDLNAFGQLPPVELRGAHIVVDRVFKLCSNPEGPPEPPRCNLGFDPRDAGPIALSCCFLSASLQQIAAVGILRAVREHPELFEGGYADRAQHEKQIARLRKNLHDALARAANAWTISDIEIKADGVATFAITHGAVKAGKRGDPLPIENLVRWCKANRRVFAGAKAGDEGEGAIDEHEHTMP